MYEMETNSADLVLYEEKKKQCRVKGGWVAMTGSLSKVFVSFNRILTFQEEH